MPFLLREPGGRLLLEDGVDALLLQSPVEIAVAGLFAREPGRCREVPDPGRYREAREPGRCREVPESGRCREARDPGRCLAVTGQAEWIGTYRLPTGGSAGGKRRFAAYFGNMEEIAVDGDALTGTPTVTVTGNPTNPAVTAVALNASPLTIKVNGRTLTAPANTVVLFTVAAGTAAAGDYTLNFHVATVAGYVFEPTATLTLE